MELTDPTDSRTFATLPVIGFKIPLMQVIGTLCQQAGIFDNQALFDSIFLHSKFANRHPPWTFLAEIETQRDLTWNQYKGCKVCFDQLMFLYDRIASTMYQVRKKDDPLCKTYQTHVSTEN